MTQVSKHLVTEKNTGVSCNIAVHELGKKGAPIVFCVHGLTRNAKDFYPLAEQLAKDFHVIMPDVSGRGQSDNLVPAALYNNGFYSAIISQLVDDLAINKLHWVGTSMGGMIGMVLAATRSEIFESLLLNDVGSVVPAAALGRIKQYVGVSSYSDSYDALADVVRHNLKPFGIQNVEVLEHFVASSIKQDGSGYSLAYDPAIAEAFADLANEDIDLSELWNLIACRTLIFRGEHSDLLLKETAEKMAEKPNTQLVEIANAGHAPSLTTSDEIEKIKSWLRQPS